MGDTVFTRTAMHPSTKLEDPMHILGVSLKV